MVLSVPFGQAVEIVVDGVVLTDILRVDVLLNVRLWTALLANLLALGL